MAYRRLFLIILVGVLFYAGFKYVLPVFTPFILGLFIAGLIEPWIGWLERRWRWSRPLAAAATLIVGVLIIGLLLAAIVGGVYREIGNFLHNLSKYSEIGTGMLDRFGDAVARLQNRLPVEIQQSLKELWRNGTASLSRLTLGFVHFVEALPGFFGDMVLVVLSAYFFSRDKNIWTELLRRYSPPSWRPWLQRIGRDLLQGLLRLFRLETSMMILAFILTGMILALAKRPGGWLIALAAGILEPLPFIGPGAILLPWAGWLIFSGQWPFAIILAALTGLLTAVRQWLEIRLMGGGLGLHPLVTLLGIYLGYKLFGLPGLVFGPLFLSMTRSLWPYLTAQRNFSGGKSLPNTG